MKLIYTGKQWLGAPVFVVEDEPQGSLSEIDVIPAIVVNQSEFDRTEANFAGQETHLRIMLDSFSRKSRQGTLEPLNKAAEAQIE